MIAGGIKKIPTCLTPLPSDCQKLVATGGFPSWALVNPNDQSGRSPSGSEIPSQFQERACQSGSSIFVCKAKVAKKEIKKKETELADPPPPVIPPPPVTPPLPPVIPPLPPPEKIKIKVDAKADAAEIERIVQGRLDAILRERGLTPAEQRETTSSLAEKIKERLQVGKDIKEIELVVILTGTAVLVFVAQLGFPFYFKLKKIIGETKQDLTAEVKSFEEGTQLSIKAIRTDQAAIRETLQLIDQRAIDTQIANREMERRIREELRAQRPDRLADIFLDFIDPEATRRTADIFRKATPYAIVQQIRDLPGVRIDSKSILRAATELLREWREMEAPRHLYYVVGDALANVFPNPRQLPTSFVVEQLKMGAVNNPRLIQLQFEYEDLFKAYDAPRREAMVRIAICWLNALTEERREKYFDGSEFRPNLLEEVRTILERGMGNEGQAVPPIVEERRATPRPEPAPPPPPPAPAPARVATPPPPPRPTTPPPPPVPVVAVEPVAVAAPADPPPAETEPAGPPASTEDSLRRWVGDERERAGPFELPPPPSGPRRTVEIGAADIVDEQSIRRGPPPLPPPRRPSPPATPAGSAEPLIPPLSETEFAEAMRAMGAMELGLEATVAISEEELREILAKGTPDDPIPLTRPKGSMVRLEPSHVVPQIMERLKTVFSTEGATVRLHSYASGICRLWNANSPFWFRFPILEGKLHPTFIEVAFAILRSDEATLERLAAGDPKLSSIFAEARRNLTGHAQASPTERTDPTGERGSTTVGVLTGADLVEAVPKLNRVARIIIEGGRSALKPLGGFGPIAGILGAQTTAEHFDWFSPAQSASVNAATTSAFFIADAGFAVTMLGGMPGAWVGHQVTQTLADKIGRRKRIATLEEGGLGNKLAGLGGGLAGFGVSLWTANQFEGFRNFHTVVAEGTRHLAKQIVSNVGAVGMRIEGSLKNMVPVGIGAMAAVGLTAMKAGAIAAGEAIAASAGATLSAGAIVGAGIYFSGAGKVIGTDQIGESIVDDWMRTFNWR